jgi:hypothetical protein
MTHRFESIFGSKGDLSRAMQIINKTYSIKLKNHEAVTKLINKLLNTNFQETTIQQFIEQIDVYPKLYGFDFISESNDFNRKIIQTGIALNMPTRVLSPSINSCIFCQNSLIIKNAQFTKSSIIYSSACIGKTIKIF